MKYDPRSFLCEPGTAEGSCHRLLLFLLVVVVLVLVTILTIKNNALPAVPASLETLVEWIGSVIVGGIFGGKAITGLVTAKGGGGDAGPAKE